MEINREELKKLILQKPESYPAAKRLSQKIDLFLGLREEVIKSEPAEGGPHQTWSHISSQEFQTPYSEIHEILSFLYPQPGKTFVDLGAGYGRVNLVAGLFFPQLKVQAYEVVPERVTEGGRILTQVGLPAEGLACADIAAGEFEIPAANYYYIFDFGSPRAVRKVLEKLKALSKTKPLTVIGRGRGIRHWAAVDHPWLSQVVEPFHTPHWSVYKSAEGS